LGAVQNRDYDALNRLVRVSDALNQQTQFQYDANDNLLVQTMPGSAPVTCCHCENALFLSSG
ncbi:RHS repeat protein, partial [Pseudoteredinibacter isoporae]